jgi:hypothetical protein
MYAAKSAKLKRGCVQNGTIKESYENDEPFMRLRVLAGDSMSTLGYLGRVVRQTIQHAL